MTAIKPLILTDVDDVLVDWLNPFKDYALARGFTTTSPSPTSWDLKLWLTHNDPSINMIALIEEFNQTETFRNLPAIKHSKEVLARLSLKFDIIAISSCSSLPTVVAHRQEGLVNQFGDIFKEIHCLPLGVSKSVLLKKYPTSVWVEDRFENALDGAKLGHKAFLISHSHNSLQSDTLVKRVDSWLDLEKLV